MLALDAPVDCVVGTGVTHSVEDLLEQAFKVAGLDWRDHVLTDASFIRPPRSISCARIRPWRATSSAGSRRSALRSW
jgi:GDP-D-mannose dehydratase